MIIVFGFVVSFLTSVILMPAAIWLGNRLEIFDYPNARKVHTQEVVRTGGIALTFGIIIPFFFLVKMKEANLYIIAAFISLFAINLLDDLYNLGYKIKFAVQILCAYLVVSYGGVQIESLGEFIGENVVYSGIFCVPVTVFYIVLVTNSINFADGLDGLVGGLCLLIFSAIGLLAYQVENTFLSVLCALIMGSIFGFLKYNTFPATVFLGDTGSIMLGFLAAISTILLTQNNSFYSPAISLLILGFPLLDAFFVILERFKEGRSIFKPDKNHFHHKLLRVGFSHYSAVVIIYSLQALFIISAFLFRYTTSLFILCGYAVCMITLLTGLLITKKINLIDKVPGWFITFYYTIQKKIRKPMINRLCVTAILLIIATFFVSSLYFVEGTTGMFSYYLIVYLVVICFLSVRKNFSLAFQVNRLALYFLGSYFIYVIEYNKTIETLFPLPLWSNYFFIALGFLFMLSNFSDLEKSYYNPVMYIVCFISFIIFSMFYDIILYHEVTLIFIKIVVFSVSIDILLDRYKPKYRLITTAILLLWTINVLKAGW